MPNLNPSGAGARMLAAGTNQVAKCLVAVGNAELNGQPVLQHALTALKAWQNAGAAHQHATHAPADYPMFFGAGGDVVISVGDGVHCIASDYTVNGHTYWARIGVMTLAERARQIGGPLLGWTDNFLGYDLTSGLNVSGFGVSPAPIPQGEDNMIIYVSTTASSDGIIPSGFAFYQGDGPLRIMSSSEKHVYDFWQTATPSIPTRIAEWTGDAIREVTKIVGLRQWNPDLSPTGKIIYSDPTKADYPHAAGIASTVSATDLTPVLAAEAKTLAAVEAIKIPAAPTHITISGTGSVS